MSREFPQVLLCFKFLCVDVVAEYSLEHNGPISSVRLFPLLSSQTGSGTQAKATCGRAHCQRVVPN